MIFDEFQNKWTNKPVDFDGVYPNQCMDLMHQYVYEVFGLTDKTILAASSAYLVYVNFKWGNLFDKIANTDTNVPLKGDIFFFGQGVGVNGHVCLVRDANINTFNSFDANWPVGSLPHIQSHNYTGALGWLRYKAQATINYEQKYFNQLAISNSYKAKLLEIKGVIDKTNFS